MCFWSKSIQECQGTQGQAQRPGCLKFWRLKADKHHDLGGLNTAVVMGWDSARSTAGVDLSSNGA